MNWDGLLLIHKPQGQTSHTVVQRLKERLKAPKAGHLGTLDPLATGVFPVCLGKATRLAPFYMRAEKCYEAAIRFGFFTTTDDREGAIEGKPAPVTFDQRELERILSSLRGEYTQKPPDYSAKKVQGKRAYELARKGSPVELPLQKVQIHDIRLLRFEKQIAVIFLHCSSGTYVRSIARDLGKRLSCGAHVSELTRTKFNHFSLEQTCDPEVSLTDLRSAFIPLERCLTHLPELILDSESSRKIANGSAIAMDRIFDQEWIRLFSDQKSLLALARVESQNDHTRLQPKIVFH